MQLLKRSVVGTLNKGEGSLDNLNNGLLNK
jgi:hypothetical protein